jgi:hypothetical protein
MNETLTNLKLTDENKSEAGFLWQTKVKLRWWWFCDKGFGAVVQTKVAG